MRVLLPRPADSDGPRAGLSGRLNRLRAGVLGANDGIVSTAGLVVGVAGATTTGAVLTAGTAGLVAGAASMGWASTSRSAAM
jgi:VIT1/CCC1 family predicted Fe2+/Mn2+ transporter